MDPIVLSVERVSWFDDRYYEMLFTDGARDLFVSTTTVLGAYPKEWLARFRGEVGNREADERMREAADHGTRVHRACADYARGGVVIYDPERHEDPELAAQNALVIAQCNARSLPYTVLHDQFQMVQAWRWKQWLDAVKPKIERTEFTVFSLANKYAGTLDYLIQVEEGDYQISGEKPVHLPGGYGVIDIKTGALNENEVSLQLASYANALWEIYGIAPSFTAAVHLKAATKSGIEGVKTLVRTRDEYLLRDLPDFLSVKQLWERENPNAKPKIFDFPAVLMRTDLEALIPVGNQSEDFQKTPTVEAARHVGDGATDDGAKLAAAETTKKVKRTKAEA